MRYLLFPCLIAFCSVCAAASPPEGFEQIFNGKDLDGWDGPAGAWRVEDGALTWESTADNPLKRNDELVWTGGEPADFELLIDFKLSKGANSGVNVRSEYHVDMHDNGWVVGSIYTYTRVYPKGLLSGRGEKTVITTDGQRQPVEFGGGHGGPLSKVFFRGQWNTMRVVCRGPRIIHYVNGELMTEITDNDPRAPRKGSISLQMHTGPPMKIQFKNIFLKRLPASSEARAGEPIDLLASRDLDDWDLLEINGQEVNRATGCDQTPGRIGFQSEGDVIEFRTAKLYPLD